MLEQMGGLSGLVASTVPILLFVPVNMKFGLTPAIFAALIAAALVAVWRIVRKESVQPAISAVIGVAICGGIAWYTGSAKGYFLYGIWVSLVYALIFVLTVVIRFPAVGLIWKGINGEGLAWRKLRTARYWYDAATLAWAAVFAARYFVQHNLYNEDATNQLALARVVMGWPLTVLVVLITVYCVRRADHLLVHHGIITDEPLPAAQQAAEEKEQS